MSVDENDYFLSYGWDFMTRLKWYGILNQLTFTCSKSIIETLENGVKYVQS